MTNYHRSTGLLELATMLAIVFGAATTIHAKDHGKVTLEAAEWEIAQLIGTPVSAGGEEIGVVSDVSIGAEGRIDKIRVRTPSPLGLGERIVEIPVPAFTILHGAVLLDLTAEEVNEFPSAPAQRNDDKDP